MSRFGNRRQLGGFGVAVLISAACSNTAKLGDQPEGLVGGATSAGGTGGAAAMGGDMSTTGGTSSGAGGTTLISVMDGTTDPKDMCPPTTCKEQGIGCGKVVDKCGNVIDCADEGLTCGPLEVCSGGVDMPAQCKTSGDTPCELCSAVKDCSSAPQKTALKGRVVTPGRDDQNTKNQVGVPNAFVYILRNDDADDLPAISSGIPDGGTSCDRCEDQDLGPVLVSTSTDAKGEFTLEGNVPVGKEFLLVVKAGRFRRAVKYTIPDGSECTTTTLPTALPDNPTRLPRDMKDGLAVNIPRIAVTTGGIDAMECVLEKMGIAHSEFGNPGDDGSAAPRVHLYRGRTPSGGGDGASIDANTPLENVIYGDPKRITSYDMLLADCEGQDADTNLDERDEWGPNVVDYVDRGGRMFVSHLRYSWLTGNGTLDGAATWDTNQHSDYNTGAGIVAIGRPQASPRIQNFADWMANEGVAMPPTYGFSITEPRSQEKTLGASSEEFVLTTSIVRGNNTMTTLMGDQTQQFSFNTPYGAADDAVCGRVAYSGFHVAAETSDSGGTMGMGGAGGMGSGAAGMGNAAGMTGGAGRGGGGFPPPGGGGISPSPFEDATFPQHCTAAGDLTAQEKVLLYMLFDLNACVGMTPPPPACVPATCDSLMLTCGFSGDGCGNVLDCGPCPLPKGPK
jgi:hypothetical protein